jgi:hypothetical protein
VLITQSREEPKVRLEKKTKEKKMLSLYIIV